jgi:pectinesterase
MLVFMLNTSIIYSQYRTSWVVAKDTSGDFQTIQEAIDACKSYPEQHITIYIKNGVYNEKVDIHQWNSNLTLKGESTDSTIISWNDYAGKRNNGTFTTYTLRVGSNDVVLENLTIENTAGMVGQAVALHVESDRVVVKNCRLLGNQDTLFAEGENSRQHYINCYIEGTTDFIFGGATALFTNCIIKSKANSFIAAASTPEGVSYGYVFINCKLIADTSVHKVFLGRPWRSFAKTVYINCDMGNHIIPQGWDNWKSTEKERTVFYAEYGCRGEGADRSKRVTWSKVLTESEAQLYKTENIFVGQQPKVLKEKDWFLSEK